MTRMIPMTDKEESAYCARARAATDGATVEELREYLLSGDDGLSSDFVSELSDASLRRIVYLAGDRFIRWKADRK